MLYGVAKLAELSADPCVVQTLYGVAKLAELYDAEIFELGHLASGHSVKYLFAGWATWHLVPMAGRDPGAS